MGYPAPKELHSDGTTSFPSLRKEMVERDIAARGVCDELVLDAMRKVPRELFLPENLREFAYEDAPLPIAGDQTISQPYIVAFMAEALMLKGGEKILEIGAGSGYAAAVLSEIATDVYTVERLGQLADKAAATLADLGYNNVHVLHGDGTRGWPEHAPYDAIVVAAGGPQVPESLKEQLKVGGRLVIPVGADQRSQELVRVTRISKDEYRSEDIADVRFVPLIGEEGWASRGKKDSRARVRRPFACFARRGDAGSKPRRRRRVVSVDRDSRSRSAAAAHRRCARRAAGRSDPRHLGILPDARTHHARSDHARRAFDFVAVEADWPDAARVDHYVRHAEYPAVRVDGVCTFSDLDVAEYAKCATSSSGCASTTPPWTERARRISWPGSLQPLQLRSASVLNYLDEVDPESARVARERYGCLTPWQSDPVDLRPCCAHRRLSDLRDSMWCGRLRDLLRKAQRHTPSMTANGSSMPSRTRAWSPMPNVITASCITARARRGICATSHMFETLKTCSRFMARTARPSSGRTIPMSATPRRPKCPRAANTISANSAARIRRRRPIDRLRHPLRHGCRGIRMGRPDGNQE